MVGSIIYNNCIQWVYDNYTYQMAQNMNKLLLAINKPTNAKLPVVWMILKRNGSKEKMYKTQQANKYLT